MQNIFGDFEQGLSTPTQMILTTPEHDMKVFIDSCKRNNVAKARMALSLGVDINCVTEDGQWSGLAVAAANNALEAVTWLLGLPGLEVNIRTEGDWCCWTKRINGIKGQADDALGSRALFYYIYTDRKKRAYFTSHSQTFSSNS